MIVSFLILSFSASLLLITTTGFFLHIPIGVWQAPVALVTGVSVSYFTFKSTRALFLKSLTTFFVLLFVSALLAIVLIDFSGDGMGYHLEAIIALMRGWNPFTMHFVDSALYGVDNIHHVNHYPKAEWIMAACIGKTTGLVEMGKMMGFLYAAMTYLVTRSFLERFEISSPNGRRLIAGFVACNPVILTQLKSYYVDGTIASLLTCFAILTAEIVLTREKKGLVYLALITLVLSNLKYPALFYGFFFWGIIVLADLVKERTLSRPVIFSMSASILISVLWIGYQPYVTNTIHLKTPFSVVEIPKEGNSAETPAKDLMSRWSQWKENKERWIQSWGFPLEFVTRSRFSKLLISIGSRSENHMDRTPKLKWPFMLYKSELIAFSETDAKYGGFGPFFCLATLLIVGLFTAYFKLLPRAALGYLAFAGIVTCSALLFSESWWARLAPQTWLAPLSLLTFLFHAPLNQTGKRLRTIASSLLVVNLLFVGSTCYAAEMIRVIDSYRATRYLQGLSKENALLMELRYYRMVYTYRLEVAGIRYTPVERLPSGNSLVFDIVPYDMKVAVKDRPDFVFDYHGLVDIYRSRFKKNLKESY